MSGLGKVIRAELIAAASVTDLVGERIYPNVLPQKPTLPAVVYRVISDIPETTFTELPEELLSNGLLQVDVYAKMYDDADKAALAISDVVGALSRHDLSATQEQRRDGYDDETQAHVVSADFSVWR